MQSIKERMIKYYGGFLTDKEYQDELERRRQAKERFRRKLQREQQRQERDGILF